MRLPVPALTLTACLVLLGFTAPIAGASTTSVAAGVLRVEAAPGESNAIQVTREGADVIVGDIKTRSTGPGCSSRSPRVIVCGAGGITSIDVRAGDKDDSVRIVDDLPATVTGGPGDDRLSGGRGNDRLGGSEGGDVLEGGAGADELSGGTGVDLLAGGPGADVLRGETGDDDLNGEDGDDTLVAGSGNDLLDGGPGVDRLLGEQGADILRGGAGADQLDGAQGDDTFITDDREVDTVACGGGTDAAQVDSQDALVACEKVRGPGGTVMRAAPAPPPPPPLTVLTPLTPFPIVRVVGAVSGSQTRLSRVIVSAPKGSRIESRCSGRGCPYRRRVTTLPAGGGRVALRGLQRRFRPGVTFEVFVTQAGRIGKYARFEIRRGRAPQRTDLCVRADAMRSVECAA